MRAKFEHIVSLIEQVRVPYIKHFEGSLWEIRITGRVGVAHDIYLTAHQKRVAVVWVFREDPKDAAQ